jgi:two-component system nitrate/nitrite response regulator NarL
VRLSPQESRILNSLAEGHSNKVIARKLGAAEATVKVHVKSILRKIGAANRTQAAMWAMRSGARRRLEDKDSADEDRSTPHEASSRSRDLERDE